MNKKYVKVDDGSIEATFYDLSDMKKVIELYKNWIKMNALSKEFGARIINAPEAISEVLVSYILQLGRTNNAKTKGSVKGKSMDAISNDGLKYQIKASSVDGGTITSFSPNTNYDKIVIIDFYCNGEWDGNFHLITLNPFDENLKVNKEESFKDQQNQKRRPRFNLIKKINKGEIPILKKETINLYNIEN